MGKYVERSMLPVFKYCKVMEADDFEQLMDDYGYIEGLAKKMMSAPSFRLNDIIEQRLVALLRRFDTGEYQDLILTDLVPKGRFRFEFSYDDETMPKTYVLQMIYIMMEIFQMGLAIRIMQGKVPICDDRDIILPKLFLITEEFYTPYKKERSMDFYELFRLFPPGICFNTFIQGSLKECKYGLTVWRGETDVIKVALLDPFCASYDFVLKKAGEHSYSLVPDSCCKLRSGERCELYQDYMKPCVNSFDECPTKKLQVVHAVLLCMQEYLIKKNIQNRNKKQAKSKKNTLSGTEKLHMDGMIAVYDYFSDKDYEKIGIRERSESSCTGTKKRPHVRSGHERHLRSGDVVNVKSSIIHKNDFSGYETGERIAK